MLEKHGAALIFRKKASTAAILLQASAIVQVKFSKIMQPRKIQWR